MGVFEEQFDDFSEQSVEMIDTNDEIEKSTYSSRQYKWITRMRERGAECGVEVPFLKHPLTKSSGANIYLKVFIVLTSVLIAAGAAALIWALAWFMPSVVEVFQDTTDSTTSSVVSELPIVGVLVGANILVIWVFILALPTMAIILLACTIVFLLKLLKITSSFVEEKAKGHVLTQLKTGSLIFGILFVVFAILFGIESLWAVVAVCLAVALYAFALFVVLQIERNKALAEFAKLPEDVQADYTEYAKKLKLVSSRRAVRNVSRTSSASSYGKWTFLLFMLDGFIDARIIFNNLKNSRLYRDTSTGLARRSLKNLLYFVISCGVYIALAYLAITVFHSFWKQVILIALAVGVIYSFAVFLPLALNYAVKQMRLNKKPLGKIALLLCLVFVVVIVIFFVLLIKKMLAS